MSHRQAVALMVLVTLLWSMAGVMTRQLDTARSFEVTFWRSLFNALTLLLALGLMRRRKLFDDLRSGGPLLWFSGLCWAVMFTAFMVAMTLTSVANVLVSMALGPMLTALFFRFFLGRRLPLRTWLSIAAGGFGIVWMFGGTVASGAWSGILVAGAVPLAAALNWTLLQYRGERGPDMLPAVLIGALLSALATLPLAWPWQASAHDLGLLALLGSVQLALPCLLVVQLSRHLPAPEIALLALLEVVFGVAWAWLWAAERPSAGVLGGGLLVLLALAANELAGIWQRRPARAD